MNRSELNQAFIPVFLSIPAIELIATGRVFESPLACQLMIIMVIFYAIAICVGMYMRMRKLEKRVEDLNVRMFEIQMICNMPTRPPYIDDLVGPLPPPLPDYTVVELVRKQHDKLMDAQHST